MLSVLIDYLPLRLIQGKPSKREEPFSGDLFLSLLYEDNGEIKGKMVRTNRLDGLKMDSMEVILNGIPSTTRAHQVQAVSIGFDGKLYLNVADGGEWEKA